MSRLRRQVAAFSLVGIANTLLDFTVLNLLMILIGLPLLAANLIATTVAMCFSYVCSRYWVFNGAGTSTKRSLPMFIATTLTGLYVIQSLIIILLTEVATFPGQWAVAVAGWIGLSGLASSFIIANTNKLIATVASAVWNFILYRRFVFREPTQALDSDPALEPVMQQDQRLT
jgi:putative flippase GtrA